VLPHAPRGAGLGFSLTGTGTVAGGWQPRTALTKGDIYLLHLHSQPTLDDELHLMLGVFSTGEEAVSPVLIDQAGNRLPGIARDANLAVPEQNRLDLTEIGGGIVLLGALHAAWFARREKRDPALSTIAAFEARFDDRARSQRKR
jgi:hypothetical protein